MNVAEVLERAADVIVERGWTQREMNDDDGRVCVLGAIEVVCHAKPYWRDFYSAGQALGQFVRGKAVDGTPWPVYWNDDPSRTADEVVAALRDCAAAERAKATP